MNTSSEGEKGPFFIFIQEQALFISFSFEYFFKAVTEIQVAHIANVLAVQKMFKYALLYK